MECPSRDIAAVRVHFVHSATTTSPPYPETMGLMEINDPPVPSPVSTTQSSPALRWPMAVRLYLLDPSTQPPTCRGESSYPSARLVMRVQDVTLAHGGTRPLYSRTRSLTRSPHSATGQLRILASAYSLNRLCTHSLKPSPASWGPGSTNAALGWADSSRAEQSRKPQHSTVQHSIV